MVQAHVIGDSCEAQNQAISPPVLELAPRIGTVRNQCPSIPSSQKALLAGSSSASIMPFWLLFACTVV